MNFGQDYSIFANGYPNFLDYNLPAGSQSISSAPVMDMTFGLMSDKRDVAISDLYKMQFTPAAYVWWSTLPAGPNQSPQPNPVTLNIGDLLGDTYSAASLAALASEIQGLILADPRFTTATIEIPLPTNGAATLTITELVTLADGTEPIQLVLNSTGSQVLIVSAS